MNWNDLRPGDMLVDCPRGHAGFLVIASGPGLRSFYVLWSKTLVYDAGRIIHERCENSAVISHYYVFRGDF